MQARVHEELDSIFGDTDRPCTFQDTLEMKYLERTILETLRLFPPVPAIARQLNEDVRIGKSNKLDLISNYKHPYYKLYREPSAKNHSCVTVTGNYFLPKNMTIVIVQYMIHRSEKYYPNPLVFNPDNFLPEMMQKRHYYSFIPFSAGPR